MVRVRNPDRFLSQLWAMERALVAAGLEPMPDWWRREIGRFYRSGKRRWVIRKGRRVFASTCVAPRLAVAEMLFGEHPHVPGSPPLVYAFLSVRNKESGARIPGIAAILEALEVPHAVAGQTIRVADQPAVFEVITASFRSSVGGTVAFAWCDEVSRWNDDKTSKNPAEQVITSLAPALATLPDARMFLVSSPLTTADFHAKAFDMGETDQQCVSFGTTWDINPTLTEAATRAAEPNERAWLREYAAVPVDGVEQDWFGLAVDMALQGEERLGVRNGMRPIFAIDPAFGHDYFGWAVITTEPSPDPTKNRLTWVQDSGSYPPNGNPREVLEKFRDLVVKPYMLMAGRQDETPYVQTDQAEFYSLRDIARSVGLTLIHVPWTGGSGEGSKLTRFRAVRTAMLAGEIRIQERQQLIRQFRSVAGMLMPSGNERIEYARTGDGHCDELSAVVLGLSVALERPTDGALPVTVVRKEDNPTAWRAEAVRKVEEKRRQEWKRSPHAVLRRAMGR